LEKLDKLGWLLGDNQSRLLRLIAGPYVIPFALGGIVTRPTLFPMANGMGLMGEAGAEAVMPLERGPGGRLGVRAMSGGPPLTVVGGAINITVQGNADDKAMAEIKRELARRDAEFARNVVATVRKARSGRNL
jgi:phage-related minor tail protein